MSCCGTISTGQSGQSALRSRAEELKLATQHPREGVSLLRMAAPDIRCGACIAAVEEALSDRPGILSARANLTAKTVTVEWESAALRADQVAELIEDSGYQVFPLDDNRADDVDRQAANDLLKRMAVAGFAAMNIMLLSVSVWSGAEGATRDLLHWVSALLAIPAVAYSGRPFFASALAALRHGRLNMDVPISLAVLLALGVSLFELINGGQEAYFDASVSLIFLLLIGRWLDGVMRAGARSAARTLARLTPRGAWVLAQDGAREYRPIDQIAIGDRLILAPGDRIAVDGVIESGTGSIDRAFLTGESVPVPAQIGGSVEAGALNLDGALTIRATSSAADSTISEIAQLVAAAEERKSGLARLADRAAKFYAPVVHLVALAVLIGWLVAGLSPREAVLIAISVLIVTCPCALGLAAPMAQAVASGVLFRAGILLKDGAALERLAKVDAAAFDKTGVLTMGAAVVDAAPRLSKAQIAGVFGLAGQSNHPYSAAVAAWAKAALGRPAPAMPQDVKDFREIPGQGVEGEIDGARWRLGSAAFCGAETGAQPGMQAGSSAIWLRIADEAPLAFGVRDQLRPDASSTLSTLKSRGIDTVVLSGDRRAAVAAVADPLGAEWRAELRPEDKIAAVEAAQAEGHRVLMVGDGLNDAPALAAADVSMAPASASDVGRASADMVFTGQSLSAVLTALQVARMTRSVILQNFALAALYNLVAVPLAASGLAGPLEAAIAMSTSSLIVTLNALRLNFIRPKLASRAKSVKDARVSTIAKPRVVS